MTSTKTSLCTKQVDWLTFLIGAVVAERATHIWLEEAKIPLEEGSKQEKDHQSITEVSQVSLVWSRV